MIEERNRRATGLWTLGITSVASCMISLDTQVVSTALNTIRLHLGTSIEELEWTVNAYTLSFAVLLLIGSALGDRFGRRRIFVVGLGLFVAASIACGLARNIIWLIVARAVQGCGAAFVMPLALTLLSVASPEESRGKALGYFGGVNALALLIGPALGGVIVQELTWEWIFWLNVPIGLIVIALARRHIEESFGAHTTLDVVGLLSVSGAVLAIVWGLMRGNSVGWRSLEVLLSLYAGILLAVIFVIWERYTSTPMMPMRFFRSRTFSSGNLANSFLFASLGGVTFFMAQFLQTALGYGPLVAGLCLLPWTAVALVVRPIAGLFISKIGEQKLIVFGLSIQTMGLLCIYLAVKLNLPYIILSLPLLVAGCGAAMAIPATQNIVISSVAAPEIGKASGTFSMLRQLSSVFGVALLVAVFARTGSYYSPQTFNNGFAPTIGVAATLSCLGAIAGMILPDKSGRTPMPQIAKTPKMKEYEIYSRSPSR